MGDDSPFTLLAAITAIARGVSRDCMWQKKLVFLIFMAILPLLNSLTCLARESVDLKNVRFGDHKSRLRMVFDFEGVPTYSLIRQSDDSVSLAIPNLGY